MWALFPRALRRRLSMIAIDGGMVIFFLFLTFRTRTFHARRNDDFCGHLGVNRSHVVVAVSIMESADHRDLFARSHAQNRSFTFSVRTYATKLHQHMVTVHGIAYFRRRNENVTQKLS